MRTCTSCSARKADDEFARDRSKASGRKSWCKACDAARYRDRYAANGGRAGRTGPERKCPVCLGWFAPKLYGDRVQVCCSQSCAAKLRRSRDGGGRFVSSPV